uniref:Uncharacterized protein n=1 Tax=Rhizophora mucronata TaxID=61149 RepID=A0A2P2NT34_RHIMU
MNFIPNSNLETCIFVTLSKIDFFKVLYSSYMQK